MNHANSSNNKKSSGHILRKEIREKIEVKFTEEVEKEAEIETENEPESVPSNEPEPFQEDLWKSAYALGLKEGEWTPFVMVRFPGQTKPRPYVVRDFVPKYGETVVCESDRGMTLGFVNSFMFKRKLSLPHLPVRVLKEKATFHHLESFKNTVQLKKNAFSYAATQIEKLKLDMTLTHVEWLEDEKKSIFYFIAPERIDFRQLVRDLAYHLRMKVELRQISLRDRAAALGGVGPCGRQLCCSSFLTKYDKSNIKMAKNQNLNLLPSKLNGMCGQIKCCVSYENEVYTFKKSQLPQIGSAIYLACGDKGVVQRHHIIKDQFDVLTTNAKLRRYHLSEFKPELQKDPFQLPHFDHIDSELDKVIGLPPKTESKEMSASPDLNDVYEKKWQKSFDADSEDNDDDVDFEE